jgi:hypothetical protein
MKRSKRLFVVTLFFAALLSLNLGTFNARDADLAFRAFAATPTAKQQCVNSCRARYRDCRNQKQLPSFECQNVFQDCTRFACNAAPPG